MIYYSHSMKIYGTRKEKKEIELISKHLPKTSIYNPNNVKIRAAQYPMDACLRVIDDKRISGVVFSIYHSHVGKGVYTEVKRALELGIFVEIIRGNKIVPFKERYYLSVVNEDDWAVKYAEVVRGGD